MIGHDPDTCGLGISGRGDCPGCVAGSPTDWTQAVDATPALSLPRRLWTWIVDRTPRLRRWRGTHDTAILPDITDDDVARVLALLADTDILERVLSILAPGIRAIVAQYLREREGGR